MKRNYIVRGKNRSIDIPATIRAFSALLEKEVDGEEEIRNDKVIKAAVVKVFESVGGLQISKEFLISSVARNIFQVGDNHESILKRVKKHIRLNSHTKGYLQHIVARGGIFLRG